MFVYVQISTCLSFDITSLKKMANLPLNVPAGKLTSSSSFRPHRVD